METTTQTKVIRWALGIFIGFVIILGLAATVMEEEKTCEVETSYQQTESPF